MTAEAYVEYALLDYMLSSDYDKLITGRWIAEDEFFMIYRSTLNFAMDKYRLQPTRNYDYLLDRHWDGLNQNAAISTEGDEYTGNFVRCAIEKKDAYVQERIAKHPVSSRIRTLGEKALERALKVVADREGWHGDGQDDADLMPSGVLEESRAVPASDRVVTFSDNQVDELENQATEVIEAVTSQNQVADTPGLREIILGQLKAGRELIKAGSFKLYVLEITLVETLRFLATRYEREAIGGLAAALITALAKHIGVDA